MAAKNCSFSLKAGPGMKPSEVKTIMRHAIVWPLVDDQSVFTPYLVSSEPNQLFEALLKELQTHLTEILEEITIEDGEAVSTARKFIESTSKSNNNSIRDIVGKFEEIIDALAEEVNDSSELSQWRIKII